MLVACCPACVFDLPPLEHGCEGDGCGGASQGSSGGTSEGTGAGATSSSGGGGVPGEVVGLTGAGDEVPQALVVTLDGDTLIAGYFRGTLEDPTRGTLTSQGSDGFVARLAPDGAVRWITAIGSNADDAVIGPGTLMELPDGEIVVAVLLRDGSRHVATPGGDFDLPASTNDDAFVVHLDKQGGFVDYGLLDGTSAGTSVRSVSAASSGYWLGGSWGTVEDGGLLARVDASRQLELVVTIGGAGYEIVCAVVPNGSGVIAIGTESTGIFALALDADGDPQWALGVDATVRPEVSHAVRLADGRLAIVGTTQGTLQPPGLSALVPNGDGDGFVIVLASSGAPSFAMLLGDQTPAPAGQPLPGPGQSVFSAAPLGDGLAVVGTFVGAMGTEAGKLQAGTVHDAFLLRLDAAMLPVSGVVFGGDSSQWGAAVATRSDDSLAVLLGAYGAVEGTDHVPGGGADSLVVPALP